MRDGWQKVSLGDLCNLTKGDTPTLKAIPGPYPLVVTAKGRASSSEYQFDEEAVCIPMVSSTGHGHASLKRVHYQNGKFALANIITACTAKPGSPVNMRYLWLALDQGRNELIVPLMKGTANVSLSQRNLATVPIALPPLYEQARIVDLVDTLDLTIAAAEQTIHSLTLAMSIMRDRQLWLNSDRIRLSEVCAVDGTLVSPMGGNSHLPHVGAERIVSGTGDLIGVQSAAADGVTSGKYRFDDRHVIYSKIRPNLRKVAVPTIAGLCSADAYPLLPAVGVPRRYLQQLLLGQPFTEIAVSRSGRTKMPKINRTELMSIEIPSHTENEMNSIAERFEVLDSTRRAAHRGTKSLQDLRSNLLTALLSGEHEIPKTYDDLIKE